MSEQLTLDVKSFDLEQAFEELRQLEQSLHKTDAGFDARLATAEKALDFIDKIRQHLQAECALQTESVQPDKSLIPFR